MIPLRNVTYPSGPMVEMRTLTVLLVVFVPPRLNLQRLPLSPGLSLLMHSRTLPVSSPVNFFEFYFRFFVVTIFDEYANILKGMYSIRFNGRSDPGGTSGSRAQR